ncbi:hypothetical protein XANCAGTX0491_005420 [Xanthoria calcicola]
MQVKAIAVLLATVSSVLGLERPLQTNMRRECTSTQSHGCRPWMTNPMVATTYMATVTATATAECGGCTAVAEKWAECEHGPVVFPFRTVTAPTKTETKKVCWETPVWVGLD